MTVLFVGPLPPPLHGFSAVNLKMKYLLADRGETIIFDRAPRAGAGFVTLLRSALSNLLLFNRFVFSLIYHHKATLYIALSGGKGQFFDLFFVCAAKLLAKEIFFHHHSFAYISRNSTLSALLFRCARGATHVVLCATMGEGLSIRYRVASDEIFVLSNAAFLDPPPTRAPVPFSFPREGKLALGFLSNITIEKGILDFFSLLLAVNDLGIPYRAVIAGPVALNIRDIFDEKLAQHPNVEYLGAVYGETKNKFFADIDILIFPSRYANEAEPMTILEAMQVGATVLASPQGCIPTMISRQCGIIIPIEKFVETAVAEVALFSALTFEEKQTRRELISACASDNAAMAHASLEVLLKNILGR